MGIVSKENLDEVFLYHAPTAIQVEALKAVNDAAKELVRVILEVCPPCADASSAIRHVRTARMEANSSIVLGGLI